MATISPAINKNIGARRNSGAKQTVTKVSNILSRSNKEKKSILSRTFSIKRRRAESDRREASESQLETSNVIKGNLFSPVKMVKSVTGSLLERIVKVMGFLAAGWIMRNLPTWIEMGKDFIDRVQKT